MVDWQLGGLVKSSENFLYPEPWAYNFALAGKKDAETMEAGVVTDLKVHSRDNCCRLSSEQMNAIQDNGVSVTLNPGTNIVQLMASDTPYTNGMGMQAEPWVLLWIYGGKFINQKTNVEVVATWASLNGYEDSLTLDVTEAATLCAFLFDTSTGNHSGELTLSVTTL